MDCKTQLDTAPRNSLEVNNKVEAEAVPVTQVSATPSNTYRSFYESWSSVHMSVTFTCYFPCVHFCSVVKHYYKSIHLNCEWFVTQYIVEHSVLMSRILYFQLNRQYVSGRHVSLSVHSLYESLNGLCICTMATASPPNSIQKRPNLFGNTWATFMANNELKWWFCGGSQFASASKFVVVLQGTNVTRFYPQWSMRVCCIAIYHD